jgi:large subunit ribosomal protein L32
MAVQKSRVTPSKRGMRRAHDALSKPTLSIDVATGETHRRHHISPQGYYKGRQVIEQKAVVEEEADEE